jgi:tetratricopeptide (TPR) repeat protein
VTLLDGGDLRVVTMPTARQAATALQSDLPEQGFPLVLERFRQAALGPTPGPFVTYAGEVQLWLGAYSEALPAFDHAWQQFRNRWAYIGRGAALAALGRDEDALTAWQEGIRWHGHQKWGETTYVYAGELALRRGELDRAARLLHDGVTGRPMRLRGWLLLAELMGRQGLAQQARVALRQAVALCPGLFLPDVAALQAALAGRTDIAPLSAELRRRCHGNASSWLYSWQDPAGDMRAFRRVHPQHLRCVMDLLSGSEGA